MSAVGGSDSAQGKPALEEFAVAPNPEHPDLSEKLMGRDHQGAEVALSVIKERPLTLFLNSREIVTLMTVGDHPDYLALGYLQNQNMLRPGERVTAIEVDEDLEVVVVRTDRRTDFEDKLRKRTLTSGCAQGTIFGDIMEDFADIRLPAEVNLRTSWLYTLSAKINQCPSLYLKAGGIHGCVLAQGDRPLIYMEDVGRHNAIDKIAGFMHRHGIKGADKIFYTTGRLTSEMVIKCVKMGIPILISRSSFTAWGVHLARQAGLTLIGRVRGKRFVVVSGSDRLIYDTDPDLIPEEGRQHRRKGARGSG